MQSNPGYFAANKEGLIDLDDELVKNIIQDVKSFRWIPNRESIGNRCRYFEALYCKIEIMRIWSLHPSYLDSKGLVALWRETLLAQKVLLGETVGYRNHPQLARFKKSDNPLGAIATYLRFVAEEAFARNYHFDTGKICNNYYSGKIEVTSGQMKYEFSHLLGKLKVRDEDRYNLHVGKTKIMVHPMFFVVKGEIEAWEIT